MPNLPMLSVAQQGNTYDLALNQDNINLLDGFFSNAFKDFTTNSTRFLKVRKSGFELVDGATREQIEFSQLVCLMVGIAPTNHAVWWEGSYSPGMETGEPDLIWKMPDFNTFPDALPTEYRKKVVDGNGNERWKFQIMRRLVFVRVVPINGQPHIDVENPFVFDASSASLFGNGIPEKNQYKWHGIMNICRRYSSSARPCYPCMFPLRIVPDDNMPVGVVNFQPLFNPEGQICFINQETLPSVLTCMQSELVKTMLEIREKLEYGDKQVKTTSKSKKKDEPNISMDEVKEAHKKVIEALQDKEPDNVFDEAAKAFGVDNSSQAEKNINNLLDNLK